MTLYKSETRASGNEIQILGLKIQILSLCVCLNQKNKKAHYFWMKSKKEAVKRLNLDNTPGEDGPPPEYVSAVFEVQGPFMLQT